MNTSKGSDMSNKAKKLNPIDDLMFRTMAEDKAFCEEILRVILSDPALTVLESTPQYAGTNPPGRSVILDAKCILGDGRKTNIEVQKANDTDHQRRVRYNGAILTDGHNFLHISCVPLVKSMQQVYIQVPLKTSIYNYLPLKNQSI